MQSMTPMPPHPTRDSLLPAIFTIFGALIAFLGFFLPWISITLCGRCSGPSFTASGWDYISQGAGNPLVYLVFLLFLLLLVVNILMSFLALKWIYVGIVLFVTPPIFLLILGFLYLGTIVLSGTEDAYFAGGILWTCVFLPLTMSMAIVAFVLRIAPPKSPLAANAGLL